VWVHLSLVKNPSLNPAQVKYALEVQGSFSGVGHDNGWGWGMIYASSSINAKISLNNYSDAAHSIICNDFNRYSIQHTVYLFTTGLLGNNAYRVTYYDGSNNKLASDIVTSGAASFSDQHTFSPGVDVAGTWHVIVTEPQFAVPGTYNPACPYAIISTVF